MAARSGQNKSTPAQREAGFYSGRIAELEQIIGQKSLAWEVGVSDRTIRRWKLDDNIPRQKAREKLEGIYKQWKFKVIWEKHKANAVVLKDGVQNAGAIRVLFSDIEAKLNTFLAKHNPAGLRFVFMLEFVTKDNNTYLDPWGTPYFFNLSPDFLMKELVNVFLHGRRNSSGKGFEVWGLDQWQEHSPLKRCTVREFAMGGMRELYGK